MNRREATLQQWERTINKGLLKRNTRIYLITESLTSTRKVPKRTIDAQIRPAYKITNKAHKTNKKVVEEKMKKEGEKDDKTNQIQIQDAEGTNTKKSKEKNALQDKT
jgi:hypothetical protein